MGYGAFLPPLASLRNGLPRHRQFRDLLGHASITTTERYDNQKLENLQAAALKLENGRTFDPNDTSSARTRPDERDRVSSFFQDQAKVPSEGTVPKHDGTEANVLHERDLEDWLGGRDDFRNWFGENVA